jgi:hypothetical protein
MMIRVEAFAKMPLENWNELVSSVPEGTIYQTSSWGDYLERTERRPYYMVAHDEKGTVVASLLAHIEGLGQGALREKPLGQLMVPIIRRFLPFLAWYHGPLIFDKSREIAIFGAFGVAIDKLCKTERIYQIKHGSLPLHYPIERTYGAFSFPAESGFATTRWGTFLIDLTRPEETLWNGIKRESRKSIKEGRTQGIEVERLTDKEGLNRYLYLLEETRERLGLALPPNYPDEAMWELLWPSGELQIFVAKAGNRLCGGLGVLVFNRVIFEIAAARSSNIPGSEHAGDLIKWAIISWGASTGQRVYDLSGVSPSPTDSKEEGIRRFKSKFGGNYVEYDICTKTYSRVKDKMVQWLKRSMK